MSVIFSSTHSGATLALAVAIGVIPAADAGWRSVDMAGLAAGDAEKRSLAAGRESAVERAA